MNSDFELFIQIWNNSAEMKNPEKEIADYKYALDQSSIVAITDQKGIIRYVNDYFCKISKYSREELIGQDHRIVNSGYHSKEFIRNIWTTIANGKIWKGEIRNKAKDGTYYWVDTTIVPFLNEEGKPFQYLAIRSDITDRKKAEEKYRLIFDSIDEGFCIIEMIFDENLKPLDYRFIEINAAFEQQTGLVDAIGKRMRELAPNHEQHWFDTYGKIALTGEIIRFENRADQLKRWFDVCAFRFGDPKNYQVAILFNDCTARKEAEDQLKSVNKELEAFSYSVAHDLRAPLRSVSGYADMLKEDNEMMVTSERNRVIDNIQRNAKKMGMLIDDLLAFSRLGRKEMVLNKVDMDKLMKDLLEDLKKSLNHKANISIRRFPEIMGDYGLLYQAMHNLVANAIKYSSKRERPEIKINSETRGDDIIFSISDNGAGFDMKYADKLFGVFQRLHKEREFEGTGIGLAIVYRVIDKHRGRIWAYGKVGEGATFYFALPRINSTNHKTE